MPWRETPKNHNHRRPLAVLLLTLGILARPAAAAPPSVSLCPADGEAAIQRALDVLPAGGEVVLAPGQYEISRPLLLQRDGAVLRGAGTGTLLHLADAASCPVVIIGPPVREPGRRPSHLRLADLLIDGNRARQKPELWQVAADGSAINNNGVHVWNAADVTIEHVTCFRCRSGGLVTAGVRRLVVNDFRSYDNEFDGLASYATEDSHFTGLRLHDNVAAGISLDLSFAHNTITNAVLAGNGLGIFMRDSRNNVFQGVTISKSHHDGVFMAQSVVPTTRGWRLVPGTECSGNVFEGLTIRDCGGAAFKVNDASCTNNVISGAYFLHNAQGGLNQPSSHPVRLTDFAWR